MSDMKHIALTIKIDREQLVITHGDIQAIIILTGVSKKRCKAIIKAHPDMKINRRPLEVPVI